MPRTALPSPIGRRPQLSTVRRRGLGGGARGLLRPLQAQHQLDQLFLAQTLKIAAAHPALESAKAASLKGVGNCRRTASMAAMAACTRMALSSYPRPRASGPIKPRLPPAQDQNEISFTGT